ncbi:Ppx/GppA phosphatase family protein [Brumimicrobium aurantiacum]|uniref:Exopolyphosphatase n=1 Tax=Brumimicrobium aurantiacum TaxID=1737063 RepID=A0A3E1F221_9FLAO|nr:rod shape-determining protein [Brumimicrobium aurantiacum]RFC55864.1 exopolyphosphatase [Brumimicrobium aurantiacum]
MKFAAIDIGTNATRLLIGEVDLSSPKGFIRKHSYVRIPLRLGVEVFDTGFISDQKLIEFKKSMQAFKLIAEIFEVKQLRICATSAMREAKNAEKVKKYIEEEVGISMEIISGQEEAELIFSTFSLINKDEENSFIVIDVGGGSTEISVFENGKRVEAKSFKIGTLRVLKNKVPKNCRKEIKTWIANNISETNNYKVFATGGNINKAQKLIDGDSVKPVSLKKLKALHKELEVLNVDERMNKYKLKPDRADTIVPALDIYIYIAKLLKIKKVAIPKIGLSDGMIYSMFLENSKN